MILDQEQIVITRHYSHLFSCLDDQPAPVGTIGRGSHCSVFRSIQWRSIEGEKRERGRIHDFAVIWDEDHDERIIGVIERLQLAGLMWPIAFIGERKGDVTVLLLHRAGPIEVDEPYYMEAIAKIVQDAEDDVWSVRFGTYRRDPLNHDGLTTTAGIIADEEAKVIAYLQGIDALWQLGDRERSNLSGLAA